MASVAMTKNEYGCNVFAWNRAITYADVAAVAKQLAGQGLKEKTVIVTGRHGVPGGGDHASLEAASHAQSSFYREDVEKC
eukprot:COSAG01_NODE_60953_length_292_cov_0.497409_1_plen_79_part_01